MASSRRKVKKVAAASACQAAAHPRNAKAKAHAPLKPETSVRETLLLDFGWKFHFGHASDPLADFGYGAHQRTFAKAGQGIAACAEPDFNDGDWTAIDLPHDWAVDLPFVPPVDFPTEEVLRAARAAHGFKPLGREYPQTSIGWYRRSLDIPASDLGRRLSLEFDGVFRAATVIFNGYIVATSGSGYGAFRVDITDLVNYGGTNVLAVRVDASLGEGWFYEGAGIYRHIWLVKQDSLHVAQWGVFVRSSISNKSATLSIATDLVNSGPARDCRIVSTLFDPNGRAVAAAKTRKLKLGAGKTRTIKQTASLASPELWSPESPALYHLLTQVVAKGKVADDAVTPFGVRFFRFDATRGFILNGKPVRLKGSCNHQDFAGVGVALPDALHNWRISKLKEAGCNAFRSAHNPPAPETLDACDRLGMLAIDETRRMSSDKESIADLEAMIRRDRNHPSIILWSIGNEEPQQPTERGARIAAVMKRRCKELDPSRPVNAAIENPDAWGKGIGPVLDVIGVNYHTEMISGFLAKSPKSVVINTEASAMTATRGIYTGNEAGGYSVAYDSEAASWASTDEAWMTVAMPNKRIAGGFIWSGFDYRGEPFPYSAWPNVSSQFGIFDACGFWKDRAWYYKAWWGNKPVLHLFPHWNWTPGENINVWCHSNLDTIELFLNGQPLGTRKVEPYRHVEWDVVFAPGTLEARGYKNGKLVLAEKRETVGSPAQILLKTDRAKLAADGEDTTVVAVQIADGEGRLVPTANNLVSFVIIGAGALIGVGNGDPRSHESDKAPQRAAFNGLCIAVIQTARMPGKILVEASAPGLKSAVLVLTATRRNPRPSIGTR
jgi:beta-galactosidase